MNITTKKQADYYENFNLLGRLAFSCPSINWKFNLSKGTSRGTSDIFPLYISAKNYSKHLILLKLVIGIEPTTH